MSERITVFNLKLSARLARELLGSSVSDRIDLLSSALVMWFFGILVAFFFFLLCKDAVVPSRVDPGEPTCHRSLNGEQAGDVYPCSCSYCTARRPTIRGGSQGN